MSPPESRLAGLDCSVCGPGGADERSTSCPRCGAALVCRYDLAGLERAPLVDRGAGVFRWAALLPVREPGRRLGLGEAEALFRPLPGLAKELEVEDCQLVQDGTGPSGSGSARGFAVAAAAWAERGALSLSLASAGPSAAPFAAAAKRHALPCRVALPSAATPVYRLEARLLKARVVAVLGDRGAAETWVEAHPGGEGDRVLSALAEPYRLEGVKTLAFETWERFGDDLPDAIVVPTGSGLELAALHRGFAQLREVGWMTAPTPRLVAAQVEACAPIARAFDEGATEARPWAPTHRTLAEGLRDPAPKAAAWALRALRESEGAAVAVSEAELVDGVRAAARHDGVLPGPEGAVALAALTQLRARGELEGARVLLLDPTAIWRSPETLEAAGSG